MDARPATGLFRALRHRAFALLWSGQTVSRVGDFVYQIAVAWWVLQKTGSPMATGAILIFANVPMLLFLLIGGVAVDRYSRVRIMLASDLFRGLLVGVVAALAFAGRLEVWHLYVASVTFGFVDAFFQPAFNALVPAITPAEDLTSANSLSSLSVQVGRIVGPALGGVLVGLVGSAGAFAVNAASFFVSMAFLLPLRSHPAAAPAPRPAAGAAKGPSVLAEAREGLDVILASPVLWLCIVAFALANITLGGPYSIALPFLVKDVMKEGADTLGYLYAAFPVGYVVGGVWCARQARIRHRGWWMFGGLLVAGLMLGLFGLPVPFVVLLLAAFVNGAALEIGNLIWVNLLQQLVPGDKLGRVSSFDMLGSYVLLPVGFALTGWATGAFGPALVFVLLAGGATTLIAVLALCHPALRRLD